MGSNFFGRTKLFKLCASSQEPLLRSLIFRILDAWDSLVHNSEASSLMMDVNKAIRRFDAANEYPLFEDVKILILGSGSDCWRQTVKWSTVYAGLANISVSKHDNVSGAWQLIANSALVLFDGYKPSKGDAHGNYVSRKGGEARNSRWKGVRVELGKLIEKEFSSGKQPFNSKKDAAVFFAPLLNKEAARLGVDTDEDALEKTIRQWLSSDDTLRAMISNIISLTPRRKRTSSLKIKERSKSGK